MIAAAADPAVGLSGAQAIVSILGVLGFGSVIAAVVNGLWTRKKLGADATEIITKAASGVVENISSDNARLRVELDEERQERRAEQADFKAEMRRIVAEHALVLQIHAAWDHLAVEACAKAGIELPAPPALYAQDATPGDLLRS